METLLRLLFQLHDLNNNGLIEENELVKLNEKIAMLHYGKTTDKKAVREKFSAMFRDRLSPDGQPVGFEAFRRHTLGMLAAQDSDKAAQEMILEQFIAEAESARAAFHIQSFASLSDLEYMGHLAGDRPKEAQQHLGSIAESPTRPPAFGGGAGGSKPPAPPGQLPAREADTPSTTYSSPGDSRHSGGARSSAGPRSSGASAEVEAAAAVADVAQGASQHSFAPQPGAPPAAPSQAGVNAPSAAAPRATSTSTLQPSSTVSGQGNLAPRTASTAGVGGRSPHGEDQERRVCEGFATGDRIQVWSNSQSEWLDGKVVEAFPVRCEAEGYSVPPGTLKVCSQAGIKWIRPGQAATALRRPCHTS